MPRLRFKTINRHEAVENLEIVTRFEPAAEFYPQYMRGIAFAKFGKNTEAAREFEKIIK